jgi:hypothetical protein
MGEHQPISRFALPSLTKFYELRPSRTIMFKRRKMWYILATFGIILVAWLVLTLYVQRKGQPKEWSVGGAQYNHKALVVFDPDPFYNLDEQVCLSFAHALTEKNYLVTIMTVAAAYQSRDTTYDLYVFCANTYNWRPDWAVVEYVKSTKESYKNKPVVAITLGAGSTASSQKTFEKIILDSGGTVHSSYSSWLWRPNDERRPEKPNVDVAVEMAYEWGTKTGVQLK